MLSGVFHLFEFPDAGVVAAVEGTGVDVGQTAVDVRVAVAKVRTPLAAFALLLRAHLRHRPAHCRQTLLTKWLKPKQEYTKDRLINMTALRNRANQDSG